MQTMRPEREKNEETKAGENLQQRQWKKIVYLNDRSVNDKKDVHPPFESNSSDHMSLPRVLCRLS